MSYFGTVINCTQHLVTDGQRDDKVFDLPEEYRSFIQSLMTFDTLPSRETLANRATEIVNELRAYVCQWEGDQGLEGRPVMIGGAPFFMPFLHSALEKAGALPVYAFSQRKSIEEIVDGKVVKTSVFQYEGLV